MVSNGIPPRRLLLDDGDHGVRPARMRSRERRLERGMVASADPDRRPALGGEPGLDSPGPAVAGRCRVYADPVQGLKPAGAAERDPPVARALAELPIPGR